jgi:uncharacterized protein
MSLFKEIFRKKHIFIPVIHVEGGAQALRNVEIALLGGADGVFLINHSISYRSLIECYEEVRKKFPGMWIGLNCLDLGTSSINYIPIEMDGLWVDNAHVNESQNPVHGAKEFQRLRWNRDWQGLYFGGVAFKYQEEIKDVARVAKLAVPFVDIITTSGPGTGKAAPLSKIRAMREAIDDHPLAIASGITLENVEEYLPYADCFLVATGISNSHTELNPLKVRRLAEILEK